VTQPSPCSYPNPSPSSSYSVPVAAVSAELLFCAGGKMTQLIDWCACVCVCVCVRVCGCAGRGVGSSWASRGAPLAQLHPSRALLVSAQQHRRTQREELYPAHSLLSVTLDQPTHPSYHAKHLDLTPNHTCGWLIKAHHELPTEKKCVQSFRDKITKNNAE
jgi:hypothetical protein